MDDRLTLMAAIIANPDEDTPRLAFADYLQEHGDEHDLARAEHIRLQVEADRHEFESAPWTKLMANAVPIQQEHGEQWLGPLLKLGNINLEAPLVFRRGLLFWWYQPTRTFLQRSHQQAVCEWFPRVGADCLILNDKATREPEVAASAALEWVGAFQWSHSKMDDSSLAALAKSPHFSRLPSFGLCECKVTDDGLRTFAETATMPNLRHFGLSETLRLSKYTSAGVLAVVNSPRFPKLCDFELESSQTTTLDYKGLFADPGLKKLTRLRLGFKSDVGAAFRCPHLTNLKRLRVNSSTVTDADVEALLANPALDGLQELYIHGMNAGKPRLAAATEKRLRDRFGDMLTLRYAPQ